MIYLFIALLWTTSCAHSTPTPNDGNVTLNGEVIRLDDPNFQAVAPARPLARLGITDPYELLGADPKQRAVNYRLLIQAAKREGFGQDPKTQSEYHHLLFETFVARKMKDAGLPSQLNDNQLHALYQERPLLRLRQLVLIAPPTLEKVKMSKTLDQISTDLKKGLPFPKIVQKYSEDPGTRNRGGDLDFRGQHNLPAAIYTEARKLTLNQVSEPIDLGDSIHIIQLTATREFAQAGAPYLEYLRAQYREKEMKDFTVNLLSQLSPISEPAPPRTPAAPPSWRRGNPRIEAPSTSPEKFAKRAKSESKQ